MASGIVDDNAEHSELIKRLRQGNEEALAELFAKYRDRMHRMIDFRLDRRLRSRTDASDVLQESYLDAVLRHDARTWLLVRPRGGEEDRAASIFALHVGVGGEGESYVFNASGQELRLAGLLCLVEGLGIRVCSHQESCLGGTPY